MIWGYWRWLPVVLLFAAVFQLFDFTQCIASYALRGYKVTKAPMVIHGIAFWGLGLLPGYLLANQGEMGIYGFWTALIVSLAVAAVGLIWFWSNTVCAWRKVGINGITTQCRFKHAQHV